MDTSLSHDFIYFLIYTEKFHNFAASTRRNLCLITGDIYSATLPALAVPITRARTVAAVFGCCA